jgi:hypothetical protein
VNHTATEELDPFTLRTDVAAVLAERAAEGEFKTRLGERKVVRVDAHLEFFAIIFLQKFF